MRLGRNKKPSPTSGEMTLVAHLSELRTRLIRSVVAIVIGATVVWIFYDGLFDFLSAPYCDLNEAEGDECQFLLRTPLEAFSVQLSVAGYGGLILAMPIVLYQLAKFVLPGLYPQEKKVLLPFVATSVALLGIGMVSGYLLMPKTLSVLSSFGDETFVEFFSPNEYIGFFVKMLLAFGVAAELPLVLVFLQLIGIVSTERLRRNRRIAIVAVIVLAAIITPTGDPFTLLVLGVPMYLSYELAMIVGSRMTKRRQLQPGDPALGA